MIIRPHLTNNYHQPINACPIVDGILGKINELVGQSNLSFMNLNSDKSEDHFK